ncbi:hypothetical protein MRX96_020695 [Rhipicephalus microplus]
MHWQIDVGVVYGYLRTKEQGGRLQVRALDGAGRGPLSALLVPNNGPSVSLRGAGRACAACSEDSVRRRASGSSGIGRVRTVRINVYARTPCRLSGLGYRKTNPFCTCGVLAGWYVHFSIDRAICRGSIACPFHVVGMSEEGKAVVEYDTQDVE